MSLSSVVAKRTRIAFIGGDDYHSIDGYYKLNRFMVGFDTTNLGPGWKINALNAFSFPSGLIADHSGVTPIISIADSVEHFEDKEGEGESLYYLVGNFFYSKSN